MTDAGLGAGAALAAGLAGSAHCAAMCGGIATAVGATLRGGTGLPVGAALIFNGARLAGYALVGAVLAATLGAFASAWPLPGISLAGRIASAVVLAALSLRLLSGRDPLGAERLGGVLFARLRPAFAAAGRLPAWARPAVLGALWGFMPCGLVYSVLLVAAASGSAATAAVVMLAFGAGTLPALLGLTLGAARFGQALRRAGLRRAAGVAVLATAAWTLAAALLHPSGAHHHDHGHAAPQATLHAAWGSG